MKERNELLELIIQELEQELAMYKSLKVPNNSSLDLKQFGGLFGEHISGVERDLENSILNENIENNNEERSNEQEN